MKIIALFVITLITMPHVNATSGNWWAGSAHTQQKESMYNGIANLNNQNFDTLIINGTGILNNVTVSTSLKVNGSLDVKKSTFTIIQINGATKIEDSKVNGDASINGSLKADDSTFKKIEISTESSSLEKCSTGSLFIKNEQKKPVITLDDTVVNGDITFTQMAGTVELHGKSKIIGKVINGTIK